VPAGWQVCPCQPADIRLSVRLLTRSCLRITELALERRRFGYRRIWQLLRREGLCVNHKRVYRIYQLNGLSVKRRRRRKGLATERLPLLRPMAPNLTWSMDFVMDALATGRRIKCLTCVDDFTKECLTVTVALGFQACRSRVFWTALRCFAAIRLR
jgi:putative transposase